MINLRYHIVSITAIFLAIGIGLTLGSTFLDRATVDNLQGQLRGLETRLQDREREINALDEQLTTAEQRQEALDEQGVGLLAGRLDGVPVAVLAARGVAEVEVRDAVEALVVAGADVQGLWWIAERFHLNDDGSVAALADIVEETSTDPSRLRRMAIDALGAELASIPTAAADTDVPATEEPVPADPATERPVAEVPAPDASVEGPPTVDDGPEADDAPTSTVSALAEAGFVEFEPVAGGPDVPVLPDGTRLLIIGGSADVPDDLVIEPLIARMAGTSARSATSDAPLPAVVSSALPGNDGVADAVAVIREDAALREQISTVDDVQHFSGLAAVVLALADLGEGITGHYGLAEGATRLLPPTRPS